MTPTTFRYGTSSWSERSWTGTFYPRGTKPADQLAFYSTQFTTVEADNTYYRVPSAAMVRGWRHKTPEGFLLSAKFPRSIVHCGAGERPDATKLLLPECVGAELDAFLAAMRELGPRAGPLVLQFPYFNREAFASCGPFLDRLARFLDLLPREFRYGVEIRNKGWIDAPLLDVLRARGVALVLVDIAYMPHPAELAQQHDLVTADFVYARLIGDRKAVEAKTETFDHIVIDQSGRLKRWAELLEQLMSRVQQVYTYANNHYAGYAPGTIHELAQLLEKSR